MQLLNAVLDLLYPPRCCACGRRTPDSGFCTDCARQIESPGALQCPCCGVPFQSAVGAAPTGDHRPHPCGRCLRRAPRFRRARACTVYDAADDRAHPLKTVLHRYKYQREVSLARPLGGLLRDRNPLTLGDYDVIVPVPLHLDRLRWRGFNQAQLLAAPLARSHGIRLDPLALERVRPTAPQVGLSGRDRRRNVARAFHVAQPNALRGRAVLLVDDVYTTGATAEECTRALVRAGAQSVDVLVLARAVIQ